MLLSGGAAQAEDLKVGLIDFARIQKEYYRTEKERSQFEADRAEKLKLIEERKASLKDLIQKQQAAQKKLGDPTLSNDNKEGILAEGKERAGQIMSLERETVETESQMQKELADSANAIQRSLTKEIYDVIGEIAEAKDMDFVLNRTFGINGVPTVAYSSEKRIPDFSDEVIAQLNENAPEGWTPQTVEAPAETPAPGADAALAPAGNE